MSNQPEHDNQQPETLTSEELRQYILAELEAGKQEIAELSDDQLVEIAGGAGAYPDHTSGLGTAIVTMCASCGAWAGTHIAQTVGAHPATGFAAGAAIGGTMGAAINAISKPQKYEPRPYVDPEKALQDAHKGMDKFPERYGWQH